MARPIDLDMLAYDISDTLDRGEYGLDHVGIDDIRVALPDFLAHLDRIVAARDTETSKD